MNNLLASNRFSIAFQFSWECCGKCVCVCLCATTMLRSYSSPFSFPHEVFNRITSVLLQNWAWAVFINEMRQYFASSECYVFDLEQKLNQFHSNNPKTDLYLQNVRRHSYRTVSEMDCNRFFLGKIEAILSLDASHPFYVVQ